jgi:hypothetical protein
VTRRSAKKHAAKRRSRQPRTPRGAAADWPYRNPATFWLLGAAVLLVALCCAGLIASLPQARNTGWAGVLSALAVTGLPVALVMQRFAHLYWDVSSAQLRSMLPGRAGSRIVRTMPNGGFVALRQRWPLTVAVHESGKRVLLPAKLRSNDGTYRFALERGTLRLARQPR